MCSEIARSETRQLPILVLHCPTHIAASSVTGDCLETYKKKQTTEQSEIPERENFTN